METNTTEREQNPQRIDVKGDIQRRRDLFQECLARWQAYEREQLPADREFPAYMLADDSEVLRRLRETYARISHRVAADEDLAKEKEAALAWCRANGNPHLKESN